MGWGLAVRGLLQPFPPALKALMGHLVLASQGRWCPSWVGSLPNKSAEILPMYLAVSCGSCSRD